MNSQVPNFHIEADNPVLTIEATTGHPRLQWKSNIKGPDSEWTLEYFTSFLGALNWNYNESSLMTLSRSGNLGLGNLLPETKLHIPNGPDATLVNGTGMIQLGRSSAYNLVMDNNEIMARNNGFSSTLGLNLDGGDVHFGRGATPSNIEVRGGIRSTSLQTGSPQNVTVDAEGNLMTGPVYKIGDAAFGGFIFWVDESGQHGLVCAPYDNTFEDGIRWFAGSFGITNAIRSGVKGGMGNTSQILASHLVLGDDGNNNAALLCSALTIGGYGDWYLPSKGELELLNENLNPILPNANKLSGFYWSSTEFDDHHAEYLSFIDGIQGRWNKAGDLKVRAVRAF